MEYENDDELLDWDLDIDENFEEAFHDDYPQNQNLQGPLQRHQKQEQQEAKSPDKWIKFSQEFNSQTNPVSIEKRWSGDGISLTSQENDNPESSSISKTTITQTPATTTYVHPTMDSNYISGTPEKPNSAISYLPNYNDDGSAKFTILNEDDADINDYDVSPMEFRGSLKTGNSPYRSETSCCCVLFRYLAVVLLGFAAGILFGYFVAGNYSSQEMNVVTPSLSSTTRSTMNTTVLPNTTVLHDTINTATNSLENNQNPNVSLL